MIISERRGFVFIHNPKSGGTSIRKVLAKFDTTSNFFWMFDSWNGRKIDKAHLPLYILRNRFPDYFRLFKTHFAFMFVRNPYKRTISAFNESHDQLFKHAFAAKSGALSGEEAAANLAIYRAKLNSFVSAMTRQRLRDYEVNFRHFIPQFDYAYIGNKRFVDLVMKLEEWPLCINQLAIFFPDVASQLKAAPKSNARPMAGDVTEFLDSTSIRVINDCYREDFEVWGYPQL